MKNRLEVAREFLREDGVIFVQCDDNEQAYLKVLMDQIFGRENFVVNIVWRRTDNQSNIGHIARVKEYMLVYSRKQKLFIFNRLPLSEKAKTEYRYSDEKGVFRRSILLNKVKGRFTYDVYNPSGTLLKGAWAIKEEIFKQLTR